MRILFLSLWLLLIVSCKSTSSDLKNPANTLSDVSTGDLAPYLFTLEDARKIGPIFEPLMPIEKPKNLASYTNDSSLEFLRKSLESQINEFLQQPDLKTDRQIKLIVANEEKVVISAGSQVVIISSGALKAYDAEIILATLCHELVHSGRNHKAKDNLFLDEIAKQGQSEKFMKIIGPAFKDFLASHFDEDTGTYRHVQADADNLQNLYNETYKIVSTHYKKEESEADIGGGILCAKMGMPGEHYLATFARRFAIINSSKVEPLEDGLYSIKDSTKLLSLLVTLDTHPKAEERLAQLQRTKSLFIENLDQIRFKKLLDILTNHAPTGEGLRLTGPKSKKKNLEDRVRSVSQTAFDREILRKVQPEGNNGP